MQIVVQHFETIDSTNLEAARQAEQGAVEGTCIVAREQTRGRGRQQRVWLSPPNAGIYLSLILRPRIEVSSWPLITLMAAVAVTDTLKDVSGVDADIKWPNDVLVGDRKISGILAETVETPFGRAVVLGIGLNLKRDSSLDHLHGIATALNEVTTFTGAAEDVLATLLKNLDKTYSGLTADGGAHATLRAWVARSSYAQGKHVRIVCGPETLEGVTRGLNSDGALKLETTQGDLRIIHAGDVRAERMKAEG
ncbi:MAG: biotin--[acetyl-CoA-carboxylase] ligase [Pyrinomonadaceae bacterium]